MFNEEFCNLPRSEQDQILQLYKISKEMYSLIKNIEVGQGVTVEGRSDLSGNKNLFQKIRHRRYGCRSLFP